MTTQLRLLAGLTALVAGLWFLSAVAAAPPDIKSDSYKKAAEADIRFLKTRLGDLAALGGDKAKDGQLKPALTTAMMLAVYGDVLGDATLKGDALKIAQALAKKGVTGNELKAPADMAAKLTVRPGTPGGKGEMPKMTRFGLEEIMDTFRTEKVGGLNLQNDIRDLVKAKAPTKPDPAAVEILATRTAVLLEYAAPLPNDKASTSAANKALWEKWMKESVETSKQLADEAAKGKSADEKTMVKLLQKLDARCNDCHTKFRDDE